MHRRMGMICFLVAITYGLMAQTDKNKEGILLTKYVDPFIGSAEHGHVFLGANVPFGLVQLGPSNIEQGWDWCSGYNYSSNNIIGFSHMHLSGTGIGDLNDILVMPTTGKIALNKTDRNEMPISTFSHANEKCTPGYYSVLLDKYKIKAELTSTERVGFHQYTFAKNDTAQIVFNLNYGVGWDQTMDAAVEVLNDSTIAGYRFSKGWASDQRIYFMAVFSQPFIHASLFQSDSLLYTKKSNGNKLQALLKFAVLANKPLELKVALSPVSVKNAALNLSTEIPDWNFNGVVLSAQKKWNKELNKLVIAAADSIKTIFYTALYHSLFAPVIYNDVNGDYLGTDKKIYLHQPFTNYTTFSLWDTYRALHPLFTIIEPEKVNDMIQSFLAIYQQQGRLPVWHLMGNETNTMNANHSIAVLVDAFLKGYQHYDVKLAYEALKTTAMQTRDGMNYLAQLKYIPADSLGETVANALEYAIDDWCIAQMAKKLKKEADYQYFLKRSQLYKKYFDPATQFMRGRLSNGNWHEPFNPFSSSHRKDDYVEGNAWQYTWLVPQDPYGLIKLFGGEKQFTKKLDSLFIVKGSLGNEASPDISGLIGQYAQGNEPNHHIPYLYSFAGEPWKTAERVRKIVDTFYTSKPNGLCGNEDLGQMSAWYVFSAMGFYPLNPANGIYILGSPLMNSAEINIPNRPSFKIVAINNSRKNIYIQKATMNGKPYTQSYITHKMIMNGGVFKLYMSDRPSPNWGVKKDDRPK